MSAIGMVLAFLAAPAARFGPDAEVASLKAALQAAEAERDEALAALEHMRWEAFEARAEADRWRALCGAVHRAHGLRAATHAGRRHCIPGRHEAFLMGLGRLQ